MDRHDTLLTVAFRNFVNVPKKYCCSGLRLRPFFDLKLKVKIPHFVFQNKADKKHIKLYIYIYCSVNPCYLRNSAASLYEVSSV